MSNLNTKDIREGVLLQWVTSKKVFEVTISQMVDENFWWLIRNGDIEPIKIIASILEAAGFEYSKGETTGMVWYSLKSISLLQINESEYKVVSGSDTRIKYVHQLQNAYPVLNNWEELTLNLNKLQQA